MLSSKRKIIPYRILFFGSDEFSATCLQTMLDKLEPQSCEVVVPFAGSKIVESVARKRNLNVFKAPAKSLKAWQVSSTYFFEDFM